MRSVRLTPRFAGQVLLLKAYPDKLVFYHQDRSSPSTPAATIVTSNQPYKSWPKIFNGDATLASAVLDRLLHYAESVIIEGKSFRMKDQIEMPG